MDDVRDVIKGVQDNFQTSVWFHLERGAKKLALVVTFASETSRWTLNLSETSGRQFSLKLVG